MDLVKKLNQKKDLHQNYLNKNLKLKRELYHSKKKVYRNLKLDHIKKF